MSFMSTHHGNRTNGSKTTNVQLAMNSGSIIYKKKFRYTYYNIMKLIIYFEDYYYYVSYNYKYVFSKGYSLKIINPKPSFL